MLPLRWLSPPKSACIAAAVLAITAFAPASYGAVAQLPPLARAAAVACTNGALHHLVMPSGVTVEARCRGEHIAVRSSILGRPGLTMTAVNPSAVCVGGYRWIQHDSAGILTTVPLHC